MTTPFVRPVTVGSVGMGALYFFTSHMVIRSMFYVGTGHSRMETAVFLLIALGSVALAHVLAAPLLRFRLLASEYVNVPAVSLLALLGALLGLTSILPVTGIVPFYLSALLTGLACGWLVVIWMSSFHVTSPDPPTFSLSPDLLCAVGFYFCFRFVSEVSRGVSDGFLMALPLVAVACILVEANDAGRAGDERFESVRESRRASLVLVCVSASFALITPLVVHLSDKDDLYLSGGLNYMVLFEVLVVALIMLCCYVLLRAALALLPACSALLRRHVRWHHALRTDACHRPGHGRHVAPRWRRQPHVGDVALGDARGGVRLRPALHALSGAGPIGWPNVRGHVRGSDDHAARAARGRGHVGVPGCDCSRARVLGGGVRPAVQGVRRAPR